MIDEQQIQEILKQYAKHGWSLRRVLLSAAPANDLSAGTFGEIEVISTDFNALWFSREAVNGGETWEIRTLSAAPFALVEVFNDDDEEEVREEIRKEMETQIRQKASKIAGQNSGH